MRLSPSLETFAEVEIFTNVDRQYSSNLLRGGIHGIHRSVLCCLVPRRVGGVGGCFGAALAAGREADDVPLGAADESMLLPLKESLACPVGLACQQSQAHGLLSGECPIEDVVLHVFSIGCAHRFMSFFIGGIGRVTRFCKII